MHATLLMLSSTIGAGGDVTPAGWGEKAPCAAPPACYYAQFPSCDSCRGGLLGRFKLFGGRESDCNSCGSGSSRAGLFDRLRGRMGGKKSADCGCGPAPVTSGFAPGYHHPVPPPGCATPLPHGAAPVTPGTTVPPPKEMPKPKDPVDPKDPKNGKDPKGNGGLPRDPEKPVPPPAAAAPSPITLPPIPPAGAAGPKVSGSNSPY